MTIYMADRHLPEMTVERMQALQQALIRTSDRFTARGKRVRYIRSAWVPSEAHVMCLFEADNPQVVRDVNEAAGIPFTRIVEAMDCSVG